MSRDLLARCCLLSILGLNSGHTDVDILKNVSPVAWQHINFYGRYVFNRELETIKKYNALKNYVLFGGFFERN